MKKINSFPKNKITLAEIQEIYQIESYCELVEFVTKLLDNQQLLPIKSSKGNGKKPTLFNAYRIIRNRSTGTEFREELLYLSNWLKNDYYLKNLKTYERDRSYVLMLNEYMIQLNGKKPVPASLNERSFEIFGREKFLDKEGGLRILKNVDLSVKELNIYETTEPLAYYTNHKTIPQTILFIENKDTFYSMRKHLLDGHTSILNEEIGTLVYGGGKGIYRSIHDFGLCMEPYMVDERNHFLYFGDLDYEGILIYEKLKEILSDKHSIFPFILAYERMIMKGQGYQLPITKEKQNRNTGTYFFDSFTKETVERMKNILQQDRYIPQEILQEVDF